MPSAIVPANGESMPSHQRPSGARHWIPAIAGTTRSTYLNAASIEVPRHTSPFGAVFGGKMAGDARQMAFYVIK